MSPEESINYHADNESDAHSQAWQRLRTLGYTSLAALAFSALADAAAPSMNEPEPLASSPIAQSAAIASQIRYQKGAELSYEPSGLHKDLVLPGETVQQVMSTSSPGTVLKSHSRNYLFVGVIKAGEKSVSSCGWLLGENVKKYRLKLKADNAQNPCSEAKMNEYKRLSNITSITNCSQKGEDNDCVDGTTGTPTVTTRPGCNVVSFYRDRKMKRRVGVLREGISVHFRYVPKSNTKVADIRIDPVDLEGSEKLSSTHQDRLYLWGYVLRKCLRKDKLKGGTDKNEDTVPGKNPNQKRNHKNVSWPTPYNPTNSSGKPFNYVQFVDNRKSTLQRKATIQENADIQELDAALNQA